MIFLVEYEARISFHVKCFLFVMTSPLFVHVQKNSSNILEDGARIKDHPTSDSIFFGLAEIWIDIK